MKLEMQGQMRLEQKMKLAPRMIQSMEILQLPILALQERIEQELNNNPVLEVDEPSNTEDNEPQAEQTEDSTASATQEFDRFENLDDGYKEYFDQTESYNRYASTEDGDKKLEAIKNTAAPSKSLHEYLTEQWQFIEAEESVIKAGALIIDYIDDRGYLSVRLEQLHNKDRTDFNLDELKEALSLVQQLDPAGVGARDIKECLLIQIDQSGDEMSFEKQLISEHMKELMENRLPDIAKKMDCSIEDINAAIERISKFDTSPGLQISQDRNHVITADVIVEPTEDGEDYVVYLADMNLPNLKINDYYLNMSKSSEVGEKTKKFLLNNIRSGRWIIEAIEQRKNTLLKVARSIVKHQKDFFDKGQLHLKPLPMSQVAEDVGVHIATVSRAVAGKHLRCYWGIIPLRKFFSGGTEDAHGNSHSWQAIRAKLQQVIDSEDKTKPLSDDQIRKKLAEMGINNLARRTVAKYRKLMNIPAARLRKKF